MFVMTNGDGDRSRLEHVAFVGDCMLLFALVSGALFGTASNMFTALGMSAGFGVLALAFAPALTLMAAMAVHDSPFDRRTMAIILAGSLIVVVAVTIAYFAIVRTGFDQAAGFGALAIGVLGMLGIVALVLIVDSVRDLARTRAHEGLDILRLVGLALVVGALVLFAGNPDFGVVLVALAGLGFVGAATGFVGDALMAMANRRESGGPVVTG